jgi:hypothetical protein
MAGLRQTITREQARESGMALCLVCFLAGSLSHLRWLEITAVAVLLVDLIQPAIFTPFAFVWFGVANAIGALTSKVLLSLIFFLVVTPVGMVRRWLGHDLMMQKRWRRDTGSVLVVRDRLFSPEDLERPY